MDGIETIYDNARDERPFSNGTDWEIWQYNNCETCIHDKDYRENVSDEGCPLATVALCFGRTPREWIPGPDEYCGDKYICAYYRHEDDEDPDPKPVPDPPGVEALFPREACEGPRILLPVPQVPAREAVAR